MTYETEIATLTRLLDQMDARDPQITPSASCAYPVKSFEDRGDRTRAYYLESCLTALSTNDPQIAVRASCQAFAYSGEDWARTERAIYAGERDYLITVRNRIEALVAKPAAARTFTIALDDANENWLNQVRAERAKAEK